MRIMIYALHGFLGKPTDWDILSCPHQAIDLFKELPIQSFWRWAKTFNEKLPQKREKRILVGYSLGGRLALHALLQNESLWDGGIIISAHPGLVAEEEKKVRLLHDDLWAKRFEKDSWSTLIQDWENQSVFAHDQRVFQRREEQFSRTSLAATLREWSLGNQENLLPKIAGFSKPLLWVAGELDSKYVHLAKKVVFQHPLSKVWIAPNAGHRVPWQKNKSFFEEINQFKESLCQL